MCFYINKDLVIWLQPVKRILTQPIYFKETDSMSFPEEKDEKAP